MFLQAKYFKRVLILFGLVVICLTLAVIQPDVGSAQPERPLSEPNPIITFYAKAMQIDEAEAERRLTL